MCKETKSYIIAVKVIFLVQLSEKLKNFLYKKATTLVTLKTQVRIFGGVIGRVGLFYLNEQMKYLHIIVFLEIKNILRNLDFCN